MRCEVVAHRSRGENLLASLHTEPLVICAAQVSRAGTPNPGADNLGQGAVTAPATRSAGQSVWSCAPTTGAPGHATESCIGDDSYLLTKPQVFQRRCELIDFFHTWPHRPCANK